MNLKMITENIFIDTNSIDLIKVTDLYDYSIYMKNNLKIDFTLRDKDILAKDYIKDELIPLLMK